MKKNRALLSIITCVTFAILLAGCTGKADKNNYSNNTTATSGSTQKKSSNNVDQGYYVVMSNEDDWEFYVIKGKDVLYDVTDCVEAYGDIPGLEYGQGAYVVADIGTDGYSTGAWDAIYFKEYKTMKPMGIEEIAEKLNIPEVEDPAAFPREFFSKYTDGNDIYYIFSEWYNYEVMKNGNPYLYCEFSNHDCPGPLQKAVSLGYDGPESMIDTDLTEDEILNMTDEDFGFYGAFKDHLTDKTLSVAELPEDESFEKGAYAAAHPKALCFGEFLVEVDDGFVLRRYYLGNKKLEDYNMTEVAMGIDEWHISEDGIVEYNGAQEHVRGGMADYYLKE